MKYREMEEIAGQLLGMLEAAPRMAGAVRPLSGQTGARETADDRFGLLRRASDGVGLPMRVGNAAELPSVTPAAGEPTLTLPDAYGAALAAAENGATPFPTQPQRYGDPALRRDATAGSEPGGAPVSALATMAEGGGSALGAEDAMERIDSFFRRDSRRYDNGFEID